jgi:hypothetical protein
MTDLIINPSCAHWVPSEILNLSRLCFFKSVEIEIQLTIHNRIHKSMQFSTTLHLRSKA